MLELFPIIRSFILDNPDLVTWIVAIFLLLIGLFLQRAWFKEYLSEWKLNHLLKNAGAKSLHNVSITDGIDEKIFVEYLILTPTNIFLLGIKKFRGLIFAADKINLWTQVLDNKSYKFENPLHQLENDIVILNAKIKNTKIVGKVLFINGSEFPKGKPDDVITIAELKNWPKKIAESEISKALLDDWNQLTELAISNNVDKGVLLDDGKSSFSITSLIITLIFLSLWLVWRLEF